MRRAPTLRHTAHRRPAVKRDFSIPLLNRAACQRLIEQDEAALRIARMGCWEYEVERDAFVFNDTYYRLHGATATDLGGYELNAAEFARRLVHPDEVETVHRAIQQAVDTADPAFEYETISRILRLDGASRWVRVWFRIQKDEWGKTIRLNGVNQDIHEQRESELRQRLTQFAIDHSTDAAYYVDSDGQILYVNDTACLASGYSRDELLKLAVPDIDPVLTREKWPAHWQISRLHKHRFFESVQKTKDGRVFPVEIHSNHIEFEGQEYHCSFVRDISERKEAEKALRESEARNRSLLNANPDIMFLSRRDGLFLDVRARELVNLVRPPEEFINRSIHEIFPPDFSDRFLKAYAIALDSGVEQVLEYQIQIRGELRFFEARVLPCYEDVVMTLVRDISARKTEELALTQANAEAQRSLALVQGLLAAIPLPVYYKDVAGRFLGCNDAYARMVGMKTDQIIGKTPAELWPDSVGNTYVQKDAELILHPGLQVYEFVSPDVQGQNRNVMNFKTVFLNENKQVAGIVGAIVDITERKQAEEEVRRLNAELELRVQRRTKQLEDANGELEAFAYSVSHDLRAPLRALDGFSKILVEDNEPQLDEIGKENLRRIRGAAQRMGVIIDGLLRLSHLARADLRLSRVDLSRMVAEIAAEQSEANPVHLVECKIQPEITACADSGLIRVALENLLANAWKFTGRQPSPRIEFGEIAGLEERTFFVRDNGAGFDMAYAGKLFGVFQRLHDIRDYPGTGIGLATVQRILTRHGGRIWAESQPGAGARFYFTLPENCPV